MAPKSYKRGTFTSGLIAANRTRNSSQQGIIDRLLDYINYSVYHLFQILYYNNYYIYS